MVGPCGPDPHLGGVIHIVDDQVLCQLYPLPILGSCNFKYVIGLQGSLPLQGCV